MTEYYTLKKPLPHDQIQHWSYVISDDRFNDAFVPVDVDTIRQQIDTAIEHAIVRTLNEFAEQTGYEHDMIYQSQVIKDARDAVCDAVGLTQTEKETKQ
jgi:hypothetical protein